MGTSKERCARCHHRAPNRMGCVLCSPDVLAHRLRVALAEVRQWKSSYQGIEDEQREMGEDFSECRANVRELQAALEAARTLHQEAAIECNRLQIALNDANAARQADQSALGARLAGLEADTAALNTALLASNEQCGKLNDDAGALRFMRPSVRRFAAAMEAQLRKNDDKGSEGWMYETYDAMLSRLADETKELKGEVVKLAKIPEDGDATNTLERIVKEAADVANFAMFVADLAYKGDRA